MRNPVSAAVFAVVLTACACAQTGERGVPNAVEPTEIAADLGGCSALITVLSGSKPVYNAKVSTRIRYGLLGAKKLDLEVFTSAGGQVKIVGLPESMKRPLIFDISKDSKVASIEFHPAEQCQANLKVQLK
jgi:hypothetical protein